MFDAWPYGEEPAPWGADMGGLVDKGPLLPSSGNTVPIRAKIPGWQEGLFLSPAEQHGI